MNTIHTAERSHPWKVQQCQPGCLGTQWDRRNPRGSPATEPVTRIELALSAWKAEVQPLHLTGIDRWSRPLATSAREGLGREEDVRAYSHLAPPWPRRWTPAVVLRTGVEPAFFCLRGRRVNHSSNGALCLLTDSNRRLLVL